MEYYECFVLVGWQPSFDDTLQSNLCADLSNPRRPVDTPERAEFRQAGASTYDRLQWCSVHLDQEWQTRPDSVNVGSFHDRPRSVSPPIRSHAHMAWSMSCFYSAPLGWTSCVAVAAVQSSSSIRRLRRLGLYREGFWGPPDAGSLMET
ncbi:hypothetical protein J3F83DRAFT_94576 [Trichoderma novae-zelandiae]